jgi:hypothetical protein
MYCDNISSFSIDRKFDIVTLVGVLEYTRIFIAAEDPVLECLKIAKKYLKDSGVLILAIENQLGLKYFSGCVEDHLGRPFAGINDFYGTNAPVTFGKRALESYLKQAGFNYIEFFYPFPDYKLPDCIVSEPGLQHREFKVSELLLKIPIAFRGGSLYRTFNEKLVWSVLERNRLIGDLANSFLILAGSRAGVADLVGDGWLAKTYAIYRKQPYRTETAFVEDDEGILVKRKRMIADQEKELCDRDSPLSHRIADERYLKGSLYIGRLIEAVEQGSPWEDLAGWAKQWIDFLKQNALVTRQSVANSAPVMLPGDYIDATPFNIIVDDQGKFHRFDSEWISREPIPMDWVVVRGLVYSFLRLPALNRLRNLSNKELVDRILDQIDYPVGDLVYQQAIDHENRLAQFYTSAFTFDSDRFRETLSSSVGHGIPIFEEITSLEEELQAKEGELQAKEGELQAKEGELHITLHSRSWRITAPLRSLADCMRRLNAQLRKVLGVKSDR